MSLSERKIGFEDHPAGNDLNKLKEIFYFYFDSACLYAESIIKDKNYAEDLVIECFERLWEEREKIFVRESVRNYLFRSVRNKCIDHLRQKKRYFEIEIEKAFELNSLKASSAYFDTTDPLELKELEQMIEDAIDQLPDACKTIFLLNRKHGLKYKEIAEQLNLSVNTVEVQMGRALKKLKMSLSEYLFVLFCLHAE
ncbi:RNA polymerase sigma-70 factor [Maribellus comscasis]|uniref:RNA polymerase sigma-70 factor n=1 Tax=Maribellus comscasis TaxID=2681766 RepID=A0A6I6JYP7_9BACT|nr:RNA polymerase sigma-70 factor [Maribellus comscasis]QGY42794.1 RNA polymerase sigma-70 factor [Maribellus comscasis]